MEEYKLICKIKQDTYINHFQAEQEGACFRGSEFKPKFDKFIKQQMMSQGDEVPKTWLLNEHKDALNYKVRIETENEKERNGKLIIEKKEILLTILCFIPELLEEIEKRIEAFFLLHNFGENQRKGYGGYHLISIKKGDGKEEKLDIGEDRIREILKDYTEAYIAASTYTIEELNNFYKDMKNVYLVPYMTRTFSLKSEEEGVYEYLYGKRKDEIGACYYIKGILGVHNCIKISKEKLNKEYRGKNKISLKLWSKDVKRFASPVLLKIVEGHAFILFDTNYKIILGKTFFIQDGKKYKLKIKTPKKFDMIKFFDKVVKEKRNDDNQIELVRGRKNYGKAKK